MVGDYVGLFFLYCRLLKTRRFSRERLQEWQSLQLRKLVSHAYETVPYYRQQFEQAGIQPKDIRTVADLTRIPMSAKADLEAQAWHQVLSRTADLRRCRIKTTSGSTGRPLQIPWDARMTATYYASRVHALRRLRCSMTDKLLCIGQSMYVDNLFFQKFGLCRVRRVSPFAGPVMHVQALEDYNPEILVCYPSVLKSLLQFARDEGKALRQPRLVITSGEFLDTKVAAETADLLGSRPVQFYGAFEMGTVGHECRYSSGLHLCEDILIPEFIRLDSGDGAVRYRLVLTNLVNYAMPFLRYDQGDIVELIPGPCSCGLQFVRIKMVEGRASNVIALPNRTTVSALHVIGIIQQLPGLNRFQIIQEAVDRITVKIVSTTTYSEQRAQEALSALTVLLPGVTSRIQLVERLDPEPSGKFRQFVALPVKMGLVHA